jgi:hypothetical protein
MTGHAVTVLVGVLVLIAAGDHADASAPIRTVACGDASIGRFNHPYEGAVNVVAGPLALVGAGTLAQRATAAEIERVGGYKIPLLLRPNRSAVVSIDPRDRDVARLFYFHANYKRPAFRTLPGAQRFQSCAPRAGANSKADGSPVTFWSGFFMLKTAPTCVRVKVAIDREPARVRTLRFGTSRC